MNNLISIEVDYVLSIISSTVQNMSSKILYKVSNHINAEDTTDNKFYNNFHDDTKILDSEVIEIYKKQE